MSEGVIHNSSKELIVMSTELDNTTSPMTSRERILERAIEVIEAGGEVAIRTNPIAAECGVTPPILYRAFESREGLVIAAQAERYRRASVEAFSFLVALIGSATSQDDLKAKVSGALDFIFSADRIEARRLRAEVIGSAVSRPALREQVVLIDKDYSRAITEAFDTAFESGWISPEVSCVAMTMWAMLLIESRTSVEFTDEPEWGAEWNQLSKTAIMAAMFGAN